GEVSGAPDTLTLYLGVSTSASSASLALDNNNIEMTRLQTTMKHAGVAPRDFSTSGLQLSPNFTRRDTIAGYEVDDYLTVMLANFRRFREFSGSGRGRDPHSGSRWRS
ncbi:MAG: SIMPL domain-containing protein, partial [Acidimicrobiales bacterium]